MFGGGLGLLAALLALSSAGPVYRVARETQEEQSNGELSPYANYTANEVCYQDEEVFERGAVMPNPGPCEQCRCEPPSIVCEMVRCPVNPNGCRTLQRPNHCCPDYDCECDYNGVLYGDGERLELPDEPCQTCYCKGGEVMCTSITCYRRDDCEPRHVPGQCCPKYENCPLRDMAVSESKNNEVRTANKSKSWPKREMQPWLLTKSAPTSSPKPGAEGEGAEVPQDGARGLNTAVPPEEVVFTRVDHGDSHEQAATEPSLVVSEVPSHNISSEKPISTYKLPSDKDSTEAVNALPEVTTSKSATTKDSTEAAVRVGDDSKVVEVTDTTDYNLPERTFFSNTPDRNDHASHELLEVLSYGRDEALTTTTEFPTTTEYAGEISTNVPVIDSTSVQPILKQDVVSLTEVSVQPFVTGEGKGTNINEETDKDSHAISEQHEEDYATEYETTISNFDDTTHFETFDKLVTIKNDEKVEPIDEFGNLEDMKENSSKHNTEVKPNANHSTTEALVEKLAQNVTYKHEEVEITKNRTYTTSKPIKFMIEPLGNESKLNDNSDESPRTTVHRPSGLNDDHPTIDKNNTVVDKNNMPIESDEQEDSSKLVKIIEVALSAGDKITISQEGLTPTEGSLFSITNDSPTQMTQLELQDMSQEHDENNSDDHPEGIYVPNSYEPSSNKKEVISNTPPILDLNSYVPYLQLGGHGGSESSMEILVDTEQTTERVESLEGVEEDHKADHAHVYSVNAPLENSEKRNEKAGSPTAISSSDDSKRERENPAITYPKNSSKMVSSNVNETVTLITTTPIPLTPADLKVLAEYLINETIKPVQNASTSHEDPNNWLKGNLTSKENVDTIMNAANISIGIMSTTDATEVSTKTSEILLRPDKFDKESLQKGNNILRNLNTAVNKTGYLHNKFSLDDRAKNHLVKDQTTDGRKATESESNVAKIVTTFEGKDSEIRTKAPGKVDNDEEVAATQNEEIGGKDINEKMINESVKSVKEEHFAEPTIISKTIESLTSTTTNSTSTLMVNP